MTEIKSWGVKTLFVVVVLCLPHGNALADFTFDIAGSTTGQFYLGSLPLRTSLSSLSFTGTNFQQTAAPGADITVDLGRFSLAALLSYYDPFNFKLSINLTEPIAGRTSFHADLSGLVTIFGGSAKVTFDNGPRHFAFTGPLGSGTFDLLVNELTVSNYSTILLTSAFMAGVIVLFRKRLRNC